MADTSHNLISVIICTHNRADYARRALKSLTRQSLPQSAFEVLLIDNASTDDTSRLASEFAQSLPNLRYSVEPTLGLSHARNRGVSEARGMAVAFLDDDAVAAPTWLAALAWAFNSLDDDVALVSGRVFGIWEAARPEWLSDAISRHLSLLDLGDKPLRLSAPELVGANMAFRAAPLRSIGLFPANLGRKGTNLMSGEEIAVAFALLDRGYGAYYVPEALAYHQVTAARLQRTWLMQRAYWEGVSAAALWKLRRSRSRLGRITHFAASAARWLRTFLRYTAGLVIYRSGHSERLTRRCGVLGRTGYLLGLLHV